MSTNSQFSGSSFETILRNPQKRLVVWMGYETARRGQPYAEVYETFEQNAQRLYEQGRMVAVCLAAMGKPAPRWAKPKDLSPITDSAIAEIIRFHGKSILRCNERLDPTERTAPFTNPLKIMEMAR